MTRQTRGIRLLVALLTGITTIWLLIGTLKARSLSSLPPPTPGWACGAGEQLPPWAICLHGAILQQLQPSGELVPLDSVPLTVTLGSHSITGTTFIHPGQVTPTYGIDISPLDPGFLQPVTITAVLSSTIIQRQVVIFPNFETQSQQFDVIISAVALAPAPLWGYVIDFATGGPVAGASVVVTNAAGESEAVTTTAPISGELPLYALDPSAIAVPGETLTLTASYGDDSDQISIVLPSEPFQVNFVTGWKCDNFDPLPETGGPGGLPETGGPGGLPDLACFWGYVTLDGEPVADAEVYLEISGTIHTAPTKYYSGETLPRYNIGTLDGESLTGTVITATAVYSGQIATKVFTVTLDDNLSQRIDFAFSGITTLGIFGNPNYTWKLTWYEDDLWAIANTGVIRWNTTTMTYTLFTTEDGLPGFPLAGLAIDANGGVWVTTQGYGVSYYDPIGQVWQTFTRLTTNGGLFHDNVSAVTIAPDGEVWFATQNAISHYNPATRIWGSPLTLADGLVHPRVRDIALDSQNNLWFATDGGLNKYNLVSGDWFTYTITNTGGLFGAEQVGAVVPDTEGGVWVGFSTGLGGVSHYIADTDSWEYCTNLVHLQVNSILVVDTPTGNPEIWFGTYGGVSRFVPDTYPETNCEGEWVSFTTSNSGLTNNVIGGMSLARDGHIWFGTHGGGVNYYHPLTNTWGALTFSATLAHPNVYALAYDHSGKLWIGTADGVTVYDPATNEWQSLTENNSGLPDRSINVILVDAQNTIWFGTHEAGVYHYYPLTDTWESFTPANSPLTGYSVQAIEIDAIGHFWFGTDRGVTHYDPTSGYWVTYTMTNTQNLVNNYIETMAVDSQNTLWVGGENGIDRFDGVSWQEPITTGFDLPIQTIMFDPQHEVVWISGYCGIHYYDLANPGTITQIRETCYVLSMALDANNDIWFGVETAGYGYDSFRYDYDTGDWDIFGLAEGLPSTQVYALETSAEGDIWVGSLGGLSHFRIPLKQSDLTMQLSGSPTARPGNVVTYTMSIANVGEWEAGGILTFTLPATITYLSASQLPIATSPLVWEVDILEPSVGIMTLTVTAVLSPSATPGAVYLATAQVTTDEREGFWGNNNTQTTTLVRDPYRADTRISLIGPPLLVPDTTATYFLLIDNSGGLTATNTIVTMHLDPGLTYQTADPQPISTTPLTWDLGDLPPVDTTIPITVALAVDEHLPTGTTLTVTTHITTSAPENNVGNNTAVASIPSSITDAQTLILVAHNRMVNQEGASELFTKLYETANSPLVQGVVLDVLADAHVAETYAAWDSEPGNSERANAVAQQIKNFIDQYTITYPNLRYLVLVGGDDILPFYRVPDQNETFWQEDNYSPYVENSTVKSALYRNLLLTDDFYADREPTIPNSDFWPDDHYLYLPDFAIGRLVETPHEIINALDTFLANNGIISLDPALVAVLPDLTNDLGNQQCNLLAANGITTTCTYSSNEWENAFSTLSHKVIFATVHGNHISIGPVFSTHLPNIIPLGSPNILVNLSCHGGLTVSETDLTNSPDLAQTFLGQGYTYISSTAYAYASYWGVSYSEELSYNLLTKLLSEDTLSLGEALVQVKQEYYVNKTDTLSPTKTSWFSYLDEKVSIPVTLYGLPMVQISFPGRNTPDVLSASQWRMTNIDPLNPNVYSSIVYNLRNLSYTPTILQDGTYYSYQDNTLAITGLPIQPNHYIPLFTTRNGQSLHGIILNQASYTDLSAFDPRIADVWPLSDLPLTFPIEPIVQFEGWDFEFPYGLGYFQGLFNTTASLNLVLGAYDADHQVERLFNSLGLEVLYSNSNDWNPPTLVSSSTSIFHRRLQLSVAASDDQGVNKVIAICEDETPQWSQTNLKLGRNNTWVGSCSETTNRFYLQIVDTAGNVTRTEWMTPTP